MCKWLVGKENINTGENVDAGEDTLSFENMYKRSLVSQQSWPWSKLIDPQSGTTYFRNEESGIFQEDEPESFRVKKQSNILERRVEKAVQDYDMMYKREILERQKNIGKSKSQVSSSILSDLSNIVESDPLTDLGEKLEDKRRIAMDEFYRMREQRRVIKHKQSFKPDERKFAKQNSIFRLKAVDFLESLDTHEIEAALNSSYTARYGTSLGASSSIPSASFNQRSSVYKLGLTNDYISKVDKSKDVEASTRWDEALLFLDRLRRMDLYPGFTRSEKMDHHSDERLVSVTKSIRKSREEFEKHGAFSVTGKNIPRTYASGTHGIEALSFDPLVGPTFLPPHQRYGAGQDPMQIMSSSLPNHYKMSLTRSEIPDKILSDVERANPMPVVGEMIYISQLISLYVQNMTFTSLIFIHTGPSKFLRAGDLMSKFQTAKYNELMDMARARRNVALDHLKMIYDAKRVDSYNSKMQMEQIQGHIRGMNNALVEGDKSWLHEEITKRHLLEATVLLENSLTRPTCLMEAPAYSRTPAHFRCPETLTPQEFLQYAYEHADVAIEDDLRWGKVVVSNKSAKVSKSSVKKHALHTSHIKERTFYIHKKTGTIQTGESFDYKHRKIFATDVRRKETAQLSGKNVIDVPVELTRVHKATLRYEPPAPRRVDDFQTRRDPQILIDSNEGIIFYCPARHLFSADQKFDGSIGFYETERANSNPDHKAFDLRVPSTNIWETLSLAPIEDEEIEEDPTSRCEEDALIEQEPKRKEVDREEFDDLTNLLRDVISKTSEELVKQASLTARNKLVDDSPDQTFYLKDMNRTYSGTEMAGRRDNETDMSGHLMGVSFDTSYGDSSLPLNTRNTFKTVNILPLMKGTSSPQNKVGNKPRNKWDPPTIEVTATKSDKSAIGIVTVKLLSCSDLVNADADTPGGLSDPYVVLSIGKSRRVGKRQKNTLNPFFNEEFKFKWNGSDPLKCEVFDYDLGNGDNDDDPLGHLILPLNTVDFSNQSIFKAHEKRLLGVPNGRITLELWFQPFAGHTYKYDPPKPTIYFESEDISNLSEHFDYSVDKAAARKFGDIRLFTFELFLHDDKSDDEESEYSILLAQVYEHPRSTVHLVGLARYLLTHGCGQEALVVLVRALECLSYKENLISPQDSAMLHILAVKMAAKYHKRYNLQKLTRESTAQCPDSPAVIAQTAKLMARMRLSKESEELFLAALLLNPMSPDALRSYALFLCERGQHRVALRYLSRIDSHSPVHNPSLLEKGWCLELRGETEAAVHPYQKILAGSERNRLSGSNALEALGHLSHVKGDYAKALNFYRRACSYMERNNNDLALILRACAAVSLINSTGQDKPDITDAANITVEACAAFRRGLFFIHGQSKWIAQLAYGEFLAYHVRDYLQAEILLWESCNESISKTIWAAIALAHFYQYAKCRYSKAHHVLTCSKRRRFEGQPISRVQTHAIDDFVCLQVALSHYYLETGHMDAAEEEIDAALDMDPKNSCALRCRALIEWKINKKNKALDDINLAIADSKNPYALRTASILFALRGKYNDAYKCIQSAVAMSAVSHPLAWRALGIMTYCYARPMERDGKLESRADVIARSIVYLGRANELAGGRDVESIVLMAQALMELGRFKEAEAHLRAALIISPSDPITLATLALCLVSDGYRSQSGVDRIDYKLKQSILGHFSEICSSYDPEELFELAINPQLVNEVAAKNLSFTEENVRTTLKRLKLDGNDYKKELKNRGDWAEPLSECANDVNMHDVHPQILYWYGMYQLQRYTAHKGGARARDAARALFERAARRTDIPPYPPAVFMLGWMHELHGDLPAAEKCYVYSVQSEPMEAGDLLRLEEIISDTYGYVQKLTVASENRYRRLQIARERKRMSKRLYRGVDASGGAESEDSDSEDIFQDGADEKYAHGGPTGKWIPNKKAKKQKFKVPSLPVMKERLVIHERLKQLVELRVKSLQNYTACRNTPGKFVLLNTFWLENLLQSFSACEDWSTLLKNSSDFRNSGNNGVSSSSNIGN